jgi:hypothetical protein
MRFRRSFRSLFLILRMVWGAKRGATGSRGPVESGHTPRPEWFRWLTQMRDTVGDKFVAGVALYAGQQILPFGDRLLAAPISTLWEL